MVYGSRLDTVIHNDNNNNCSKLSERQRETRAYDDGCCWWKQSLWGRRASKQLSDEAFTQANDEGSMVVRWGRIE